MKKFIFTISALAFFAGAYFIFCGFVSRLPRGVIVNGTDVGGLTFSCAARVLRKDIEEGLRGKTLNIYAAERKYEYSFPEVYYSDNLDSELRQISSKGEYSFPVFYYLNGAESVANYIVADCGKEVEEPSAAFNYEGEPFTYYEGCDGVAADRDKLLEDISVSLNGDWEDVVVSLAPIARKGSLSAVKERTQKLCSFTTYFDPTGVERSSNIRLAASAINGTIIPAGGCFSFNATVGERTEERGYKQAKIIEEGKFVLGLGGGVCQVSTTLYNAALLSGLEIAEYHPHSLSVSYVAPSRDAMVSGNYFDLRFVNNRQTPIYVRVKCTSSSICCVIYGESDGYNYSFKSEVVAAIPKPGEQVVEGDEDKILSYGKEGTESLGYLIKEKDGNRESVLVRRDKYAAVADVRSVRKTHENTP